MAATRSLKCSLCDLIMEDPVELTCCGILQCNNCAIDRFKYANQKCWNSKCGKKISLQHFKATPDLWNIILAKKPKRRTKSFHCYVCGSNGHRTKKCPTIICICCNEKGHAEIDCPNKAKNVEVKHNARVNNVKVNHNARVNNAEVNQNARVNNTNANNVKARVKNTLAKNVKARVKNTLAKNTLKTINETLSKPNDTLARNRHTRREFNNAAWIEQ